jgi:hypothetical protein
MICTQCHFCTGENIFLQEFCVNLSLDVQAMDRAAVNARGKTDLQTVERTVDVEEVIVDARSVVDANLVVIQVPALARHQLQQHPLL